MPPNSGRDRRPAAGPDRILQAALARHKDADPGRFRTLQRPVLCFLAISREPVTVPQLMEWTHLDPGDIKGVITEWREFLNEDPDTQPPRYRIYHRSFAEFLDDRGEPALVSQPDRDNSIVEDPQAFRPGNPKP